MRANPDVGDPDVADVLGAAIATSIGRLRTAIPAEVVAFDGATQTITAQITVRSRYLDADGAVATYRPKPIPNVPIAYPSGAGGSIVWPLVAGDPVILLVAERSIAEWKNTGSSDNIPTDPRRFDLSDAIAIPGVRSPADPLGQGDDAFVDGLDDASALIVTPPTGGTIKLGGAAATDPVALAPSVEAYLATLVGQINALITTFNAHTHVASSFGSPTTPPATPASSTDAPTAGEFDAAVTVAT